MRISTQTITLLKGERPIVAVTAYDAIIARYADEAGVDLILVGDSVGTSQFRQSFVDAEFITTKYRKYQLN